MNTILTVVIPVYNGEKYVRRAVESVIAQPEKDAVCVLLIDDGSTDRSGKICDDLAEQYSNVHVIHKENGGVSSARNLGIQNVTTKYIAFLDCDDWWEPDFLDAAMVKTFSDTNSADIYQFSYREINNTLRLCRERSVKNEDIVFEKPGLNRYDWQSPCSFIFSCRLLRENAISVPIAKVGEDSPFVEMALFHAKSYCKRNRILFNYWENMQSCTHSNHFMERLLEQYKGIQQESAYLSQYGVSLDADVSLVWMTASLLPKICTENTYVAVDQFMSERIFPVLEKHPDIRFQKKLWSRIEAWQNRPRAFYRKNKICLGTVYKLRAVFSRIPFVSSAFNYLYNRYHRKLVPYQK